jgi:hypothetical protein
MRKRWNTWRIALWGATVGAVYTAGEHGALFFSVPMSQGLIRFEAVELMGSVLIAALLAALVSHLHNLILRA